MTNPVKESLYLICTHGIINVITLIYHENLKRVTRICQLMLKEKAALMKSSTKVQSAIILEMT